MTMFFSQLVGAVFLLFAVSEVEPLLFPVVQVWSPTQTDHLEKGFTISGYMVKTRNCKFVGVQVEDQNGIELPITFLDNRGDDRESRPVGSQPFGPWVIQLRPDSYKIKLSSVHDCHPVWTTTTALGTINVYTQK